jgi:hypothetical protein
MRAFGVRAMPPPVAGVRKCFAAIQAGLPPLRPADAGEGWGGGSKRSISPHPGLPPHAGEGDRCGGLMRAHVLSTTFEAAPA